MESIRRQNFHSRKLLDYRHRSRRNPALVLPHEGTIQKVKHLVTRRQRRHVEQFLSTASNSSIPLAEADAWHLEDQVESHSRPAHLAIKVLPLQVPLGEYVERSDSESSPTKSRLSP